MIKGKTPLTGIEITGNGTEFCLYLDIPVVELARQITLIDHHYFSSIPPREFLRNNFSSPEKSPNISKIAEVFEKVFLHFLYLFFQASIMDWFRDCFRAKFKTEKKSFILLHQLSNCNNIINYANFLETSDLSKFHRSHECLCRIDSIYC